VIGLLGVGMLRAQVLPPVPVTLFSLTAPATVVTAAVLTAAGVDPAEYIPLSMFPCVLGFVWLGWAMWREPALDAGRTTSRTSGPLVA